MPPISLAVLLGAALAFYGNRLDDPLWSAYLPLLLWLAWCQPARRPVLLGIAAMLWANAVLGWHLDRRLGGADDHRDVRVDGRIVDLVSRQPGRLRFHVEVDAHSPASRLLYDAV